jgi:hypothetical protein
MAIVANALPMDTMTVGKLVAYFDPTADAAGLKYGTITNVRWDGTGTAKPCRISVQPSTGGSVLADQDAQLFRVVDKIDGMPRPNV